MDICKLTAILATAYLIGNGTLRVSAPTARGEHPMRHADDHAARLTFALFSGLPSGAGTPAGPEWTIAGAEIPQPLVVDRLSSLPKAAQCTAIAKGGGFRIVCESIDGLDEDSRLYVERVRSGVSLLGRLLHRLADHDLVVVSGRSFSLQLPASELRQWVEDYRLQPRPDVSLRDPTRDELRSGIRAALYLEVHADQVISGIEGMPQTKRKP